MAKITVEYLEELYRKNLSRKQLVELLNEKVSEPEWVVDRFPETAGFYLVTRKVLDTHTDEFLNDRYIDEVVIIFYFKERNVTGWEKDWTNKPSNVIGWMPLPNKPV